MCASVMCHLSHLDDMFVPQLIQIANGPKGDEVTITLPTWDVGDCYNVHKILHQNRDAFIKRSENQRSHSERKGGANVLCASPLCITRTTFLIMLILIVAVWKRTNMKRRRSL